MTTLTSRVNKTSELTFAEGDDNFERDILAISGTYTADIDDNRTVYQCTSTFNFTLPDAASMLAANANDYEVTVKNIGTGVITVLTTGTDTLDGAAAPGTFLVTPRQVITFKVNATPDGWESTSGSIIQSLSFALTDNGTATSLAVDFAANFMQKITGGAGNFTFTSTTYAVGASVEILFVANATSRTLTFPAGWTFLGYKPTATVASSTALLALRCYTAAESGVVATWVETP